MNVKIACPHCGKKYKNRCGMSSHMRNNHPEHFAEWTKGSKHNPVGKRAYRKRRAKPAAGGPVGLSPLHYCPHCGRDLRPVMVALSL